MKVRLCSLLNKVEPSYIIFGINFAKLKACKNINRKLKDGCIDVLRRSLCYNILCDPFIAQGKMKDSLLYRGKRLNT